MDEPGSRGRVQTWTDAERARRAESWRPSGLLQFSQRLRTIVWRWLVADTAPGRLVPWLPIAFATGIAVYFATEREPEPWAALVLVCLFWGTTFAVRRRPLAFPLMLAAGAAAAGYAAATLKSAMIAHPVLTHVASNVEIAGWVAAREERERSDRIVVQVHRLSARRINEAPDRVRVSVRKGTAPPIGTFIEFKARLSPPLQPLRPGGYDFARDLWFQRIGASGFVLGAVKTASPPGAPSRWLSFAAVMEGLRDGIDRRIRTVVTGDTGSIASALITGKRDAISAPVNEAMYVSSLAHVLSISGYHMAVVAGLVFLIVRGALALVPSFANHRPIKKWAAAIAIFAAAFYLLLSGAEVATQRSFIMTAVVLGGVLIDRAALTLRTLAVAALLVMVTNPQAVVHPSFQMSFAAALALVAAYERGLPWTTAGASSSLGARFALWGVREAVSLVFASMVAGLATTLFAAYHFHRLAPYGVLANLLAMPVVSGLAMPAGILALLAMPFGFDNLFWQLMAHGIDWMIAVANWVSSLPGAVGRMKAFGTGPLLTATAGLVLICLLRTPLRMVGLLVFGIAIIAAVRTPQPDILIAEGAEAVAVRGADGRLAIMKSTSDRFAVREWLSADADARTVGDPSLSEGVTCDEAGCVARAADDALVAFARTAEAYEDDCAKASILVTRGQPPADCAATVFNRAGLQKTGALALRRVNGGWERTVSRPAGYQRPWAKASAPDDIQSAPASRRTNPDATPRSQDMEPGD